MHFVAFMLFHYTNYALLLEVCYIYTTALIEQDNAYLLLLLYKIHQIFDYNYIGLHVR